MKDNASTNPPDEERVHGYAIKRSIVFENDRGFALAENPNAPQPFVTWQFTENENGARDFYWGHYTTNGNAAAKDYEARVADYMKSYGVTEKVSPAPEVYKYYSTQRPVDIGTFPKTENGPAKLVNFNDRESVEHGTFRAWGYLLYAAPLTQKQMDDYELRAAPGNPDRVRREEQVQAVGQWEEKRKVPDGQRFTWWYPDFGSFVKKEYVTDEQLAGRYEKIMEGKAHAGQEKADKKPISEQLKEAAKQAERGEAPPEKKKPHSYEDR